MLKVVIRSPKGVALNCLQGAAGPKGCVDRASQLAAGELPVAVICRALGLVRPGCYESAGRRPSALAVADAELTTAVDQVSGCSLAIYGSPRLQAKSNRGVGHWWGASGRTAAARRRAGRYVPLRQAHPDRSSAFGPLGPGVPPLSPRRCTRPAVGSRCHRAPPPRARCTDRPLDTGLPHRSRLIDHRSYARSTGRRRFEGARWRRKPASRAVVQSARQAQYTAWT